MNPIWCLQEDINITSSFKGLHRSEKQLWDKNVLTRLLLNFKLNSSKYWQIKGRILVLKTCKQIRQKLVLDGNDFNNITLLESLNQTNIWLPQISFVKLHLSNFIFKYNFWTVPQIISCKDGTTAVPLNLKAVKEQKDRPFLPEWILSRTWAQHKH